jgi:hypothetical protein
MSTPSVEKKENFIISSQEEEDDESPKGSRKLIQLRFKKS